jgi:pimeloyl-ACP methyl ester carboxylesterase
LKLVTLGLLAFVLFIIFEIGWLSLWIYRRRQIRRAFQGPFLSPRPQSLFKTVDGVRLHYLREGNGKDIFLLHGLGANIYCWRHLVPLLINKFRVWAIDLKGFGLSDKPHDSSYSLSDQASLLAHLAAEEGLDKIAVVGNSMGGAIAAQMALDWPGLVEKVVLIDSAHDAEMFGANLKAFSKIMKAAAPAAGIIAPLINEISVGKYMPFIYGRKDFKISKEDIQAYVAPYTASTDSHKAFVSAFDGLMWSDLTSRLSLIQSHILILWGKNDKVLPFTYGEKLHHALPQSQYFVHPTGGHHLQEEEPQWVASHIARFLN